MLKTAFVLVMSLMLVFAVLQVPVLADNQGDGELDVEIGISPESHFYFLQNLWESLQLRFTFNAEKRAQLHQEQVMRRAVEMEMVQQRIADGEGSERVYRAMERVAAGYAKRMEAAQKFSEGLEDGSQAAEKLMQGLEQAATHMGRQMEALEDALEQAPEEARQGLENAMENARRGTDALDKIGPRGPGRP